MTGFFKRNGTRESFEAAGFSMTRTLSDDGVATAEISIATTGDKSESGWFSKKGSPSEMVEYLRKLAAQAEEAALMIESTSWQKP